MKLGENSLSIFMKINFPQNQKIRIALALEGSKRFKQQPLVGLYLLRIVALNFEFEIWFEIDDFKLPRTIFQPSI